jgi:peptidoglycan/LPS O-acetylase OafA/YrhL
MNQHYSAGSPKIGVVNGLRGVAILMVVLHHLFIPYAGRNPLHAEEIDPNGLFAAFVSDAWLGVNIFFVLSGFVLYLPCRLGSRRIEGLADFWSFYLRRAKRLLPLYYIVVLVSLALHAQTAIGSRAWYLEFGGLFSTLFIFSPYGFMPPSNIVLWSVGVEIWFSLIFPALVLAIRAWGTEKVVLATIGASAAFMFVGAQIPIGHVGFFRPFSNGIFGACYEFVLGMFVCDLYVRRSASSTPSQFRLHALLGGVLTMAMGPYLMHHGDWAVFRIIGQILFAVGVASILFGLLFAAKPLRWVFENWLLQLLGCMCYSIYAWHGIVMNEMIPPATSLLSDTIRLSVPFSLLILMLSALSYRYIEFGHVRDWRGLFLLRAPSPEKPIQPTRLSRPAFKPISQEAPIEN